MNALAENLKVLRAKFDLTQVQVGEAVGVGQGAVSKWESGEHEPDATTLLRLALLYQVSVEYLLRGANRRYDALYMPDGVPRGTLMQLPPALNGPLGEEFERLWNNPRFDQDDENFRQTLVDFAGGKLSQKRDSARSSKRKGKPSDRPRREG